MIFRAIIGIGLVALLMPREPDLGLGRPGAGTLLPAAIHQPTAGHSRQASVCNGDGQACAGGLAWLDSFQQAALQGLADVKAQLEASRKAREAGRV